MDISPQTLSKLLLIGQYQLPSEYFAIFLQKIYDDLSNCFSYIIPESLNIPQYMDYESCVLNEAYSTILIFIIEALKNSIGEEALKSNLEDCLWPQNMIDTFIHFYSVNQVTQLKVGSLFCIIIFAFERYFIVHRQFRIGALTRTNGLTSRDFLVFKHGFIKERATRLGAYKLGYVYD